MSKKTTLKISKTDFDPKKELTIYDYDSRIENYHKVLDLHPSISGSRGGNAALASLLNAFDGELWDDDTTA